MFYIHGGVDFVLYRESFKRLIGREIFFMEPYMASEGSFGFQAQPNTPRIKLVLNNSIFYEFVPFNKNNFNEDGLPHENVKSYLIHEINEKTDYAIVLSTCAGLWRYVIGDVVRFTNAAEGEIVIVGRTKQFLSLCGEHMSIDNIHKAIDVVSKKLNITIKEFTVCGFAYENLFAHRWFIGCDDTGVDEATVKQIIDTTLCKINDDYAVERTSALKDIFINILPSSVFYEYMRSQGKDGAMNKFPRVMKGDRYKEWRNWLKEKGYVNAKDGVNA